ncbi:hypothetical protein MJO29_013124 [Puccinia striiformis f. sp. tritici]|uniref:hypothetical protein n=1 Tax=Puccinia striiformis f. sp. tritici TaxID=168172 RepID=UPI0020074109|nr:hypothetical protein Pst134EA_024566 [Puccinia striiformis f. sp. tritici]KAH9453697.1 hypothetical protein Pst134EA_024566 [Puccinia striiformis f. sp. tritici]KAI7943280.1 hypothetical protein MJO29_013124 [Puccinia striiformis f. sp. tritici]
MALVYMPTSKAVVVKFLVRYRHTKQISQGGLEFQGYAGLYRRCNSLSAVLWVKALPDTLSKFCEISSTSQVFTRTGPGMDAELN